MECNDCKNLDEISTIELIEELKKRDKIRVESAYETEIISIGDRIDERMVFELDNAIVEKFVNMYKEGEKV